MRLRILTWNCCGGDAKRRVHALSSYAADILILTEVLEFEKVNPALAVWSGPTRDNGRRQKGIGVITRPGLGLTPCSSFTNPSGLRVTVTGLVKPIDVIGIWSRPPYMETTLGALSEFLPHGRSDQVVVAGDFNDNAYPDWLRKSGRDFREICGVIESNFGARSAYHSFTKERFGGESRPTLYWRGKVERTYHIDYIFLPSAWTPMLRKVEIPPFHELHGFSDHRPVVVDVDMP